MRLLVTGGAGYIGSRTVRRLIDAGHEVSVLDTLEKGRAESVDPRSFFLMTPSPIRVLYVLGSTA
jgi:UDP-glucose 4-epimerase